MRAPRRSATARFGASAGAALRLKERRVVWRDPWLMSQLLLQAAYTTPLAVILWRGGGPTGTVGVAFTPALVVIAAQLAGALVLDRAFGRGRAGFPHDRSLAARRDRTRQDRRDRPADRRSSSLCRSPHWPSLRPGRVYARFCSGRARVASAALVNLWRQAPSRRGLVLRRHSQSKLVGMMEHLVSILWAVATTTAVIGSWATVVPLAAVAGVLALNRKWAAGGAGLTRA